MLKVLEYTDRCLDDGFYPVGKNMPKAIRFVNETFTSLLDILPESVAFINIWCTGSSGAILAGLLANKLLSPEMEMQQSLSVIVQHIKKDGEEAHEDYNGIGYAGMIGADNDLYWNIIIDDDIASGNSMTRIYNKIEYYYKQSTFYPMPKIDVLIVGIIQYEWDFPFTPTFLITSRQSYIKGNWFDESTMEVEKYVDRTILPVLPQPQEIQMYAKAEAY